MLYRFILIDKYLLIIIIGNLIINGLFTIHCSIAKELLLHSVVKIKALPDLGHGDGIDVSAHTFQESLGVLTFFDALEEILRADFEELAGGGGASDT